MTAVVLYSNYTVVTVQYVLYCTVAQPQPHNLVKQNISVAIVIAIAGDLAVPVDSTMVLVPPISLSANSSSLSSPAIPVISLPLGCGSWGSVVPSLDVCTVSAPWTARLIDSDYGTSDDDTVSTWVILLFSS